MKTDRQLHQAVVEALEWEPSIIGTKIGVAVSDGVVTLSGTVPTYAEKCTAEQVVRRVPAVKAIAEEVQVQPIGMHQRTDAEIAEAVSHALQAHVWVPTDVQAVVENGRVMLRGEVTWEFQRSAASQAVRYLAGVRGLSNTITIRPREPAAVVERAIEQAMQTSTAIDPKRITVSVYDRTVTLIGNVRSWDERGDAERVAWGAPGVSAVDNRLIVLN